MPYRARADASATTPPPFILEDLAGATHALAALRGRPALVHFFATWCEPCREELQSLNRFRARTSSDGPAILAISVGEPDGRVRRFFAQSPVGFPVLLDREKSVMRQWRVIGLPTTILLKPDLSLAHRLVGDIAWDEVDPARLLSAPPRPSPQSIAPSE